MTHISPDRLAGLAAELTSIRRDIHRHPETAFEETRTAQIVADKLTSWGIEIHRGLATTGVVGTLKGTRPGQKTIGLRADMDALHLQEKNDFDYASSIPNKMHACGHDGHTTMLLGAAKHLAAEPDFAGTVHFIFQPAEEGSGGARVMIEEGLFDKFNCDAVYGMHNMPGFREGPLRDPHRRRCWPRRDSWEVTFKGTGGHGAMPDRGTDPTFVAAQFIVAVQGIIGRNVSSDPGRGAERRPIHAGTPGSPNVIPSEVLIKGTARSFSPRCATCWSAGWPRSPTGIARAGGCEAVSKYHRRYPALVNAVDQTKIAVQAAALTVGRENVEANTAPIAGAEDFAFMLEKKPGAYIMIGNGGTGEGGCQNVHSPLYDFSDEILTTGAAYWVNLVQVELGDAAA